MYVLLFVYFCLKTRRVVQSVESTQNRTAQNRERERLKFNPKTQKTFTNFRAHAFQDINMKQSPKMESVGSLLWAIVQRFRNISR